ncbi:MAG TPA: hypothetical protein V6C95_20900 [Coleofasciculaceae cyanobacterium]
MKKQLIGLVLLLTLATTLGACNQGGGEGGGGETPATPTESPS